MPSIQDYVKQYAAARAGTAPATETVPEMAFPAATPPKATSGNWSDLAITGAKGVIGLGEAAVGLADIPTMGYAGKGLQALGYDPAATRSALEAQYSPYRQELNRGLSETKGFLPTLGYMAQNPSTIGHAVVESIPATLGGGAIGRGVGLLAPKLAGAIGAGIGEGTVQAGSAAEQIRQQTEGGTLSAGQVGSSLASGALTGLIGAKSGALATRMGLPDPDVMLSTGKGLGEMLKPGYLKRVGTSALIEGVLEELPQSAQEQVWQNVALGKPIMDSVAESAAQGLLAGMGMGAGFAATQIRRAPPGQVTDDQLKGSVDEALAPPTEPLQAEHDQMQREFAAANAPQGNQYPGIARMSDKDLQDLAARLGSEQGKNTANSAEILDAVAQELQARAPKPETPLSRADQDIADAMAGHERATAVDMGLDLFGNPSTPTAVAQPVPVQEGIAPATDLSATPQMFDAQGNVQPEIAFNERAALAQPRTSQEEVAARLQAARAPAPNGQATLMAGQLPAAGPIALAQAGTPVRIPESTLKGLPPAAKTELSKHLGDGQIMAAAVADMYYTKMSEDTNRRPVGAWVGKLPALYQQLTGQAMPETPEQAQQITQTAIGAQGADFLQGETPAQAAENYARQQDLEALNRPLPDVTVPKGQASFLTPQGEVDTIQKGLSRRESAKQTQARAYAAKQKAARQQAAKAAGLEPANTNIEIPEAPNAVQKSGSEGVDVRQPAQARQKMAKGNAQGQAAAAKGQAEGEVNVPATVMATPSSKGQGNLKATSTRAGGTEQGRSVRGVSGSTGTPEASNSRPVAVGAGAAEQPAGVKKTRNRLTDDMKFATNAYLDLVKPEKMPLEKFIKRKIEFLTPIAELEQRGESDAEKEQAKEYLDTLVASKAETAATVKAARDKAAKAVPSKEALDEKIAEREKALADRAAAEEAQTEKDAKELANQLRKSRPRGPLYSIGTADKNGGMDVKSVMGVLQSMFNSPTRLNDLVNVVASEAELSLKHLKALNTVENGKVGAFFNPETGKVWIIAGNMAHEREVFAVMLHEVGVHMGMRNLLGKNNYDKLISQLDVWEKAGTGVEGELAKKATERAAQAEAAAKQKPDVTRFNEERLAYFVEEAVLRGIDPTAIATQPKSMRQWFSRLWTSLQAALRKLGMVPSTLTAEDVVDLAYGSAYITLDAENITIEPKAASNELKFSIKSVTSPTTIKALTDYKAATAAAATLMEKVTKTKPGDMKLSVFKNAIPWFTKHHLVSQFDKLLGGGLSMNAKADSIQESTTTRFNQMFNEPYHQFEALTRSDPERAKAIGELMRATEMKIDPRKSWDDQKHLHSLTGTQLAQTRQYANEYKQKWGKMPAADQKLYSDLAKMNETMYTAELAVTLYNIVRANPGAQNLKEFQADPSEKFRQSGTTHGAIQPAQDYWRGVLDTYTAALEKYVAEQRGLLPQKQAATPEQIARDKAILREIKSDKNKELVRRALRTRENTHLTPEQQKMVRHLTPLEAQLKMANDTTATFEQAPYFHLGRFGDQFVSFRVRTTNDGEYADPAAMEHVQKVLAEKFDDVTIRTDAMDPHVFARFESVDTAQSFVDTLRELQKQGWLMQKGVKDKNNKDLGAIVSQSRADIIPGYHTAGPNWLTRVVESIQGEDYDDATKAHMVAHVRSLYLDSLPDTAAIKVKQKREGRPGWHADMLRSYAHRMRVGSNRIGSLAAEPTRTQSFSVMKDAKSRSETDPNMSQSEKSKLTQVIAEFERRNSEQMAVPHTPAIDVLRATNHAFFLGMSPSYLLLQMTQLGVLTWPELAKRYGFVNAGKTLAKVTPLAFKVITHTISEGYKARGLKGAADMVVTGEMLENAGLSQEDANFLVKVMAAGKIDIGNAAREIGRVSEGDKGSEALKIASALGYASETVTRIATALAAKRMHDQAKTKTEDVVDYAIKVIDESMLNYTSTNVARMTGKHGLVGTVTPVMFSFMQYQFQLLEKLYREIYTAYSKGSTKDQQAEARTFLAGHMMSMMTLAGSLGLPFASVIAAAADKMCGLFGEGYCDSTTAMRNMTAAVFGHDIEPLLSKGVPRALGFDISARAGEGDVLPFSKFLNDKRKMEDALKDLAWSSWGAPSSMIASMYKGYERVADGDLLGGMQEGFPLALKGPVKAYEMSTKGYTDKAGNVLPMTPGAWDIMVQTLGLQPGEKADYQQAKFAQSQRKGVMGREATMIRNKLATSIEQGDDSGMRDWMKKAREFDSQNPGQAGILTQMGSTLQQRARLRAQAAGTGTPLGVSPKDYEAQKFTSFYR